MVVVFANKNNIKKKEIKTNIAKEWTKAKGYFFYESSPKSRNKVNDAFKKLFDEMFQKTIENISKYIYLKFIFFYFILILIFACGKKKGYGIRLLTPIL